MAYRIGKEKSIFNFTKDNKPVLSVPSGSTIVFETCDCFEDQIKSEDVELGTLNWEHINPATGPLYIEEAKAGDVLKVELLEIKLADYGVMAAIPGDGLLGKDVKESQIKILPIKDGKAVFNDSIQIPLNPMIGVIGVAPQNESIPTGTPSYHGGNMDNTKITQGTILYLPVSVDGALLAMGDVHACMGDGEIMVTGVEIAGEVKVKVEVIKGNPITNPILEDKDNIYTIASDEDLMWAIKIATKDMHEIIMNKLNLSYNEAGMLLSAAGNVQICQVVDPKSTVRMAISKKILNSIF